jgi:hypothetical protein
LIRRNLQAFAEAWDSTKDQESRLENEQEQLETSLTLHDQEISRYNEIITSFERVTTDDSAQPRDWNTVVTRLQDIQTRFADQISDLSLPELAISCLETPFRNELVEWDSLSSPSHLVDSLTSLSTILEIPKITSGNKNRKRTTPFESLLLLHWYPKIRTTFSKAWDVYDPESAVPLINAWTPLIPSWLLYKILNEIVLPRLVAAVKRFPKMLEQPNLPISNGGTNGHSHGKKRKAPAMHLFLMDWWQSLSDPALSLEQFPELRSLIKSKIDGESWDVWKPLLGSHRPRAQNIPSAVPRQPAEDDELGEIEVEEIPFRDIVEEWASENNLLLTSTHKADHLGRLLFRIHDAEKRNRGVTVYFGEDILVGADDGVYFGLDDTLVKRARGF